MLCKVYKDMEKVKPLSPKDINNDMENIIPDVVIKAVNNLLKKEFRGSSVKLLQKDVISEISKLDDSMTSKKLFDNNWMDFESLFKKYGWSVVYDGPGYNETYEPNYEFTPRKK